MGLLEILDHRLCGIAQHEPLSPGPGQAVFLSGDDLDVSATIVQGKVSSLGVPSAIDRKIFCGLHRPWMILESIQTAPDSLQV
jgi:hypothetical protein